MKKQKNFGPFAAMPDGALMGEVFLLLFVHKKKTRSFLP